ncbi:hypothetical protein EC991_007130 [Linnemannia zychae]|nr:hypothetical protein EC991_007130 [Linnemannia zychae]
MRILSLSLCAAAIACVAAQAAPEQQQQQQAAFDVVGNQDNYAWATSDSLEELSLKADQLAAYSSEITFRAELLESLNPGFEATALIDCSAIKSTVDVLLDGIIASLKTIAPIPLIGSAFQFISTQLEKLKDFITNPSSSTEGFAAGLGFAFSSLKTVLSTLQFLPLPLDISLIVKTILGAESVVHDAVHCVLGGSKLAITQDHCVPTADLYRLLVNDASTLAPILPEDASDEWKRIAAGASSVLELSKNAIAKSNEELLSTRPIFAADLLNQYRDEYLRVADTDDAKIYAQSYLGAIVGVSNALEACLRVAADPAEAYQELQQDLNAQSRFEEEDVDEDDENEDKNDDEDQ